MSKTAQKDVSVTVRDIGGIDEAQIDLKPGVNVLAGRNATNRTSFLQAIMTAIGSNDVAIKGDADEGSVSLRLGEETYERSLKRRADSIAYSGDPYLDDPEVADLFAFLLESNEARRSVTTGQNLRDIIMRPVDTDEIKSEITRLEQEKDEIDEEIEAIEEQKQTLPELEAQRTQLEDEIAEVRSELADKEREIDEADADIQAKRAEQEELEEKLEALREACNDLEDARYDIDTESESIESLKQDRATLEEELDALPETSQDELDRLDSEIDRLRRHRRRLDSEINSLQNTVQFNEDMLDGERSDIYDAMIDDDGHTTDELVQDSVVCWTCGSEVDAEQIESTIESLRNIRQEKLDDKRDVADELADLKADKDALDQQRQKREQYQRQLREVETELKRRGERVEELQDERQELEDEVKQLEAEVEGLESGEFDAVLDLHKEANQLEYELGRLENDLESVKSQIEAVESQIGALSELEDERTEINEELTELRTRVESLEEEAVEAFNDHMDEVLGTLNYENLERIWIERVQREVPEGRRKAIKTFFEMHVVRSTPSGTTYEDTIDHLSESEREVTGLVFALAGYLVHEVYEEIPFMLLDSLEAIDSERIAELVDYFGEFADYLVVALLEEDAAAIVGEHNRVQSI